jgi:hypothetical protein
LDRKNKPAGTPNDQLFSKDVDLTAAREGMFLEAAGSFDIRISILEIHRAIWTREVQRTPLRSPTSTENPEEVGLLP